MNMMHKIYWQCSKLKDKFCIVGINCPILPNTFMIEFSQMNSIPVNMLITVFILINSHIPINIHPPPCFGKKTDDHEELYYRPPPPPSNVQVTHKSQFQFSQSS